VRVVSSIVFCVANYFIAKQVRRISFLLKDHNLCGFILTNCFVR
jgi:hypothetical protein